MVLFNRIVLMCIIPSPTSGSLHRLLRDESRKHLLTWPNKLQWAKDIAEGLKYLHDNRILHGDIKSHNMYVACVSFLRVRCQARRVCLHLHQLHF